MPTIDMSKMNEEGVEKLEWLSCEGKSKEDEEPDPDQPRTSQRARVQYMDLLRKVPAVCTYTADGKPNYKRFKKVWPKGAGAPKQYIKLIDDPPRQSKNTADPEEKRT